MVEATTRDHLEAISSRVMGLSKRKGVVPLDWGEFDALCLAVQDFEVPSSTFTPHMCALVWALTRMHRPRTVVGLGTHVGWTLAWIAGLEEFLEPPSRIVALDTDPSASQTARCNLEKLGHGTRLESLCADANDCAWDGSPIDLLFVDVDCPQRGKADYGPLLERWRPWLSVEALVLGHDVCVPRFARDFEEWRSTATAVGLRGPIDLAIDDCGLSVVLA